MPPPPGLTKADVKNFIELYHNEEGGQARFAVYVGKPGPKAWCPVKDLAEARRKAGDMNSAQSIAIREGQPLTPTISFDDWRAEQLTGNSGDPSRANGKGKSKGKGKTGKPAGPRPTGADDVDALVASIEAAASEGPAPPLAETPDHAAAASELTREHAATLAASEPEPVGRRVRIDGLAARPELNGRCGVATRFDVTKGRYQVEVEGEAEPLLLKPTNLRNMTMPAAAPELPAVAAAESAAAGGDAEVAAREAARSGVMARVAAARAAQALGEAARLGEAAQAEQARRLQLDDLLSAEETASLEKGYEKNEKFDNTSVKDFRMQGEFGAKKFIKP